MIQVDATSPLVTELSVRLPSKVRCAACVERVCDSVRAIAGVSSVECDSRTSKLVITHDPARVSVAELDAEVARIGLEAASGIEHEAYRVSGLD